MKEEINLYRPTDVVPYKVKDPKKLKGKYLPHAVRKKWFEDFKDEDTGEIVSIERYETIAQAGEITEKEMEQLLFALQAGDIEEVEVTDVELSAVSLHTVGCWLVEIREFATGQKTVCVTMGHDITQALQVLSDYISTNLYSITGDVKKIQSFKDNIIPKSHPCFADEEDKKREWYRVQDHQTYYENGREKFFNTHYIVWASNIAEAKERTEQVRLFNAYKANPDYDPDEDEYQHNIRRAAPFTLSFYVSEEYFKLYN